MAVYLIESKADQQKLIDHVGENTAKLFFSMKDRLKSPENDIYYWLKRDPMELEDRLNGLQSIQTRSQKDAEASEGAELLYNQNGWKVYHITTYEASAKYGKNTQWCITGSKRWNNGENGEYHFKQYTDAGIEFYFYIKDGIEKYALAYAPSSDRYQVFNTADNDISDEDLSFLPNVDGLPRFNYNDISVDNIGYKDDKIFLLSIEEYMKYHNIIPPIIDFWWWLRSHGDSSRLATCVLKYGNVNSIGVSVDFSFGAVRPALKFFNSGSANLDIGDTMVLGGVDWIKIDEGLFIARNPITSRRFDENSNDYDSSEIRAYLLNWLNSKM